jgi:hypothetical protein
MKNPTRRAYYYLITACISLVWLLNGLFCKILHRVPRHELIVARILGAGIAPIATIVIGILETAMGIWILSRIKARLCAITQIIVVLSMNALEFILAPDLLLFGRVNAIVALAFVTVVWLNETRLRPISAN